MATIPQIRLRLLEAFPENQADLLRTDIIAIARDRDRGVRVMASGWLLPDAA